MKIMVSACLAGENCKYNGGNNRNEKVLRLMADNQAITVCPEQMGGLPTPRVPSEIKDGLVTAKDGRIVDAEFRAGAVKCLEIAGRWQPDLVVLQSRSPSCGVKQRYDGTFTGRLVDQAGVTARLLMENGFRCLDVEDLVTIHGDFLIRKLSIEESDLLKDFLYEAIFIPEGVEAPARDIVERPELRIYYDDFGSRPGDQCFAAETEGNVVGAVWTRIMNDYGHVDDETPSFAISLLPDFRNKGIGTRLMREMLSLLKECGYKQASLAVQKAKQVMRYWLFYKMNKKARLILLTAFVLLLTACSSGGQAMDEEDMVRSYTMISQDQAKEMMEKEDGHIIIDVRRVDEFETGHIPGAVCIPNESIGTEQPEELPDLDQIILVYCRSGNRSKQAAQKLFDMGYTNVYEFGGIIDWTGEIE